MLVLGQPESLCAFWHRNPTLIDWDDIVSSNTNRQIHAHTGSAGKPKVDYLAERIKLINPSCIVHAQRAFYTPENADELILPNMNYVLDAIDRKIPKYTFITIAAVTTFQLSAWVSQDPKSNLGESDNDPLLAQLRKVITKRFDLRQCKQRAPASLRLLQRSNPYPDNQGNICTQNPLPMRAHASRQKAGFGSITHLTGSMASNGRLCH